MKRTRAPMEVCGLAVLVRERSVLVRCRARLPVAPMIAIVGARDAGDEGAGAGGPGGLVMLLVGVCICWYREYLGT